MTIDQMLPYILVGAAILLLVMAFLLLGRKTTTVVGQTKGDVLDEGAQRASRNQALIDAPRAVAQNVGVTSANANSDSLAAAPAAADAEAGASVAPSVAPSPVPQPAPTPAPTGAADDLRRIKGVGPKLVTILADQGVTRFEQIAAWSDADIERVDATLGRFSGRITRDQWVEQAKLLAAGDDSGFAARFGNNR